MHPKRTIVVLAVAAAGSIATWLTWRHETGAQPGSEAERRFLHAGQLPIDRVERIELRWRDGRAMDIVASDGGEWRQTTPFEHPLSPFSVRQLIAQALELTEIDAIDEAELDGSRSAAALSLAPPLAAVSFHWPGGGRLGVELGRQGIAGRAYLRLEGERTVRVVSRQLHDRVLDMDPKEWRDRTLFWHASVESDRIVLDDGETRVVLVRDRKRWVMEEPVRTRVDADALDELLQALGRARSGGFLVDQPEQLAAFHLDRPPGSLTVVSTRLEPDGDGGVMRRERTERLLIGSRIGASTDRFAMIEGVPSVLRLGEATLATIFRSPGQLVDPTGSAWRAVDVKMLEIRFEGGSLRLERDLESASPEASAAGGNSWPFRWFAPDHGRQEVDVAKVEELLHQLTSLRAPRVELRRYPRDLEVGTVILYGYDGQPMDTVRIARSPDKGEWALENGDDVLRVFPPGLTLRLSAEDYGLTRQAKAEE